MMLFLAPKRHNTARYRLPSCINCKIYASQARVCEREEYTKCFVCATTTTTTMVEENEAGVMRASELFQFIWESKRFRKHVNKLISHDVPHLRCNAKWQIDRWSSRDYWNAFGDLLKFIGISHVRSVKLTEHESRFSSRRRRRGRGKAQETFWNIINL